MNQRQIRACQAEYGFDHMQQLIDSGHVWYLEGSMGREAMRLLKAGACFLPLTTYRDYWGNLVPSRTMIKKGAWGTLEYSSKFFEDFVSQSWY